MSELDAQLGMVAHACSPSPSGAEAGGSWVLGQPHSVRSIYSHVVLSYQALLQSMLFYGNPTTPFRYDRHSALLVTWDGCYI